MNLFFVVLALGVAGSAWTCWSLHREIERQARETDTEIAASERARLAASK